MSAVTSWVPTWELVATKQLEIRRRRGLMLAVVLLTVGVSSLVLGVGELLHVVDPKAFLPAGSPAAFHALANLIGEFGFIAAAALGAAAATTDLTDGVFRHLVATGRSRLALYLARIPAGLSLLLPLVAVAFTALCLMTVYAGAPPSASVSVGGVALPAHLGEAQLRTWLEQHPRQALQAYGPAQLRAGLGGDMSVLYGDYAVGQTPAPGEMVKVGLWLELEVGIAFLVGLGLGSLTGQRTASTILLIALQIIVTPILAAHTIPYFLDAQRLVVGVAMDQLRPVALPGGGGGGPLRLGGGPGGRGIPPMPTWAMIAVIVGWIVGWSVLGAWKMATRDA